MGMPSAEAVAPGAIIDGRALARRYKAQVAAAVARLKNDGIVPGIAVIRVGDDESSRIYVRNKARAADRLGIASAHIHLPADTSAMALSAKIRALNNDDAVDGILLQLPLPDQLVPREHLESIDPQKDVDGFHPVNLGKLMAWDTPLRPCTPSAVMAILEDQGVELLGAQALVVGRSIVVGRPMTQLLIKSGATVIVCHRHTQPERLASHVGRAEVVVTATGVPKLIKGEWIKPGAVVCDIGITRMPDGSIQGDVDFEPARRRAGAITPVPGGVGPMTIAMLLRNTVVAARLRRGMDPDPEL